MLSYLIAWWGVTVAKPSASIFLKLQPPSNFSIWCRINDCVHILYDIHNWRIVRSSHRRLARMGFDHIATEFHSDTLINWIRVWFQLAIRENYAQLLQQFHLFVQYSHFILAFAPFSCHIYFKGNLVQVILLVAEWIDGYGIHNGKIFRNSHRKLTKGSQPSPLYFLWHPFLKCFKPLY